MDKEYLTISDLAQYLSVKRSTLYAKVESGEIPFYRIGRLLRFRKSDVEKWMEGHISENIDVGQRANRILKTLRQRLDIHQIVRKAVEEENGSSYNFPHGKPDPQVKGFGKEVKDGTV